MNIEELISEIEILQKVSAIHLESVQFEYQRPFKSTEDKPFCDWCFSGWTQYIPDLESGIYFICWPKDEVVYIGKATANNLGAEIWGKFGKPHEDNNGNKTFSKSYFLSNMSESIENNKPLQNAILNGGIYISTITVSPFHISSFIEVYLQTVHCEKEHGKLPLLNRRIG